MEAALEHWYVTGLQQQGAVPSLIASVGDDSSSLLSVVFELNPEESTADQLLRVHSQPVEIIYDAVNMHHPPVPRSDFRSDLCCLRHHQSGNRCRLDLVLSVCKRLFVSQLTVNSMAEFFKTGKGVDLEVLTSATLSKLEEIKEKTATGQFDRQVIDGNICLSNTEVQIDLVQTFIFLRE